MAISLTTNPLAVTASSAARDRFSDLARSTQRLSTGLRINASADDASGLAIRERMRADIAATRQGIRNATDAISMLQTVDGALAVIDEKLIRMQELAEQAASGTYNDVQREMINDEFMMMGSEINRIANANNWNGINLIINSSAEENHESTFKVIYLGNKNTNTYTIQSSYSEETQEVVGADGTIYKINLNNPEGITFQFSFSISDIVSLIGNNFVQIHNPLIIQTSESGLPIGFQQFNNNHILYREAGNDKLGPVYFFWDKSLRGYNDDGIWNPIDYPILRTFSRVNGDQPAIHRSRRTTNLLGNAENASMYAVVTDSYPGMIQYIIRKTDPDTGAVMHFSFEEGASYRNGNYHSQFIEGETIVWCPNREIIYSYQNGTESANGYVQSTTSSNQVSFSLDLNESLSFEGSIATTSRTPDFNIELNIEDTVQKDTNRFLDLFYDVENKYIEGDWVSLDLSESPENTLLTCEITDENGTVIDRYSAQKMTDLWVSSALDRFIVDENGNFRAHPSFEFEDGKEYGVNISLVFPDGQSVSVEKIFLKSTQTSTIYESEIKFIEEDQEDIPSQNQKSYVKIHFNSGNSADEDYYYIKGNEATLDGLNFRDATILTQEEAQKTLDRFKNAIAKKDSIRAYYGTMQNRLENTIASLQNKVVNLETAEARISNADIASEMSQFVTNQILAKSATAMVAQANIVPRMVYQLLQ